MGDLIAAIAGSLGIAIILTTLVLPGRQTPAIIGAIGTAYSSAAHASEGLA